MVKHNFFKRLGAALSVVTLASALFFLAACNNKKKEATDNATKMETTVKSDTTAMQDTTKSDTSGKGEQTPPPK